ncbi:hypothetical protein DB30_00579 [Enhygromyxa salina]|uniref:DUF2169 domain-containing protein n=1 Tax=Enhygromyxa salina TaxID=215803 RepID=A0A0C1Z648_9BACT|nr:DUF2169 domain-containing protein [Enhygromyxa salina]KIG13114.1 hypothetical protein DB30_00579 [Enhygromyxa salina]
MWALHNQTAYAADRNWTRDEHGVHWWVVAVRATFMIAADGKLSLSDEQLPPLLAPEHYGVPGDSSLRYDSELLGRKPSTDVVVLGSAHAPGAKPAPTVPVTLRIGSIDKTLLVHGARIYHHSWGGLSLTEPRPFTRQPIRYEVAFGGRDSSDPDPRQHSLDERNPIGRGFARRSALLANTPAHAIEYPRGNPATMGPAGFGPIDRHWLPRRSLAGTYDAAWAKTKQPLLPDDYNPHFAMCAPADQRTSTALRGGERLGLFNLSPHGALVLELPHIQLVLESHFGQRVHPHEPPVLTTVLAEPDDGRLSLVWQSVLRVPASDTDYLDETRIVEKSDAT